ncbi:hypothetical protein A0H81_07704 [Grifola frondosa]|uniref:Uncharacterized protein n=1 Tax=Grifola frondosa TaxID=5627 RepID=A0A1C7M6X1_GRIFR|nr:hypothetical protein A0H81_07704 [Grifola frondosa]
MLYQLCPDAVHHPRGSRDVTLVRAGCSASLSDISRSVSKMAHTKYPPKSARLTENTACQVQPPPPPSAPHIPLPARLTASSSASSQTARCHPNTRPAHHPPAPVPRPYYGPPPARPRPAVSAAGSPPAARELLARLVLRYDVGRLRRLGGQRGRYELGFARHRELRGSNAASPCVILSITVLITTTRDQRDLPYLEVPPLKH